MRNLIRLVLAGAIAASLTGVAAMSSAGPAGNVTPHHHYVKIGDKLVEVGPAVCEKPSLQHAFNQFHANVHVGTPGTFAMDHPHNRTDITIVIPCR
jgi:hypothetical protein